MREPLRAEDPRVVGRYRLRARLGEGGQGAVFLGEGPEGEVAVKVLHGRLSGDSRARQDFAKELAAARQVQPFCTAAVLDADIEGDTPYIVSEFVAGAALNVQVAEKGPYSGTALHRLAVGTATALTAIHKAGVVHRDFKPGNVLIAGDGPRVIDFGVARRAAADATATGVAGTPAFMAPEQVAGAPPGPAADMFAWAATMLFAATGRPPFGGDSIPVVFYRIQTAQPDVSMLEQPLRGLVAACLAKDPSLRLTAREVMLGLVGHEDSRPIGVPQPFQPFTPPYSGQAGQASAGRMTAAEPAVRRPHHRAVPFAVSMSAALAVTMAVLIAAFAPNRSGADPNDVTTSPATVAVKTPAAVITSSPPSGLTWIADRIGLELEPGWKVYTSDAGTHVVTGKCVRPYEYFSAEECHGFWVMGARQISAGAHGSGGGGSYTGKMRYNPASDVQPCFYPYTGMQGEVGKAITANSVLVGAKKARYLEWPVDCMNDDFSQALDQFHQREWFVEEQRVLIIDHQKNPDLQDVLSTASWR
ncbi:serine/threonine protein kinase [Sphaerisporangium dianthi]|uniref:Serine/threonine protein kinase n=1 Tax=Sphaerisporangium dianthi TaxID=1436120 RepID=A0ABV9CCU6_9ACTN